MSIPLGGGALNAAQSPVQGTDGTSLKKDIKAKFENQNKRATTNVWGQSFKGSPDFRKTSDATATSQVDLKTLNEHKIKCGERHEFMLN